MFRQINGQTIQMTKVCSSVS